MLLLLGITTLFLFVPSLSFADPVAYWPFEEPTGTATIDATGNGHDGVLVNGVQHSDGISGLSLEFSNTGDAVEIFPIGTLGQLQQVSISAWVRQAARGEFTSIVDARDLVADGYDLYLSNTDRLFLRVNQSTLMGPTVVADNTWHHVAGVWDGLSLSLYVDGVLDATTIIPVTTVDVVAPLLLGRHFQDDSRWELSGSLDEVQIYDRALAASEVLTLSQGNITDTAAPLRSNAQPMGLLPAGTVEVTLGVDTDEAAECRWSDLGDTPYDGMVNVFLTTGGQSHSTIINGVSDGETHTVYLRCSDSLGNVNTNDVTIQFTIDSVAPGEPGLLGHWPFEDLGGVAFDTSGNGHDATLGGGAVWGSGQVGAGLDLQAAGDYAGVEASPLLDQPGALTIAAWIQHPPRAEYTAIVDKRDAGSDGYDLYLSNTGRGFIRVNASTLAGTVLVTDGTWHHLAATWDGSSLALYVDGMLDASLGIPPTTVDTSSSLLFGRHFQDNAQWEFAGLMDEVRLYDRALTVQEISALAQTSPIDQSPPVRGNASPNGTLAAGTTATVLQLDTDEVADCRWSTNPGVAYPAMPNTFSATGASAHATTVTGLIDGGSYTYAVRCVDLAGNANADDLTISFQIDTTSSGGAGLLAHWPFEENGGAIAFDASGQGKDATLVNSPQWAPGIEGLGLSLTGSSDGGLAPASVVPGPLSALSIAAWVRHDTPTSFSSIVDQRDAVDDGYDLYLSDTGTAFIRINASTLVGATPIADGTWHHLAAVWDGGHLTVYVDGAPDASTVTPTTVVDVTGPVHLGRHFQLNSQFESAGSIDEVRIYDRALTASEVAALTASEPRLTLSPSFVDRHVLQRIGTTADLPLSGSYIGSPTAIEGRIVDALSGDPLDQLNWMPVDSAPTGGTWSGTLPNLPQGGWYRLELRFTNDHSVDLTPSNRLGVGMIVAAMGQSSMAKLFTEIAFTGDGDLGVASQESPHQLTHRYGYGNPRVSATQLGGYLRSASNPGTPHYGDVTGDGGVRFANQLAEALEIPILILDFAIDGTSILEWTDPQWIGRLNFDAALTTVGGDFEALVWFQSGEDILNQLPAPTYLSHLNTFYDQIQAQLPTGRPLELFEAVQGRGDYPQSPDASYAAIRQVQIDWPQQRPHIHAAGTAIDLHLAASSYSRGDGHYTASQMQILADRYTRAILNLLNEPGFAGGVAGPRVASAVLSGSEVTVHFTHDQGTALTVPSPGLPIEGFELSTDGFTTVLRLGDGISGAQLSTDGQSVVLDLANAPAGQLTLRYLYGMNPFGHKSGDVQQRPNGNTVFDNFQYHPDRAGLPVLPTTGLVVGAG